MTTPRFAPMLVLLLAVSTPPTAPAAEDPVDPVVTPATSGRWEPLTTSTPEPTPRLSTYAVHDPVADRMVFFGGWGYGFFDDTWTLDLSAAVPTWTQIPTPTHPSGRLEHTTIYDPVRHRMLMFGGKDASQFYNDLWQLDLTQSPPVWSQITPLGTPPTPRESRAVYDPVHDRMVITHGFGYPSHRHLNSTWVLELSGTPEWRQVIPHGRTPSARRGQTAIYDPVRQRLLMFGGYDDVRFYDEVWELTLGNEFTWRQVITRGAMPTPRYGITAAYDHERRLMVVYGGYGGSGWLDWLDDTYVLALDRGAFWSRVETETHPGRNDFYSMIHDPVRDRLVVFGGNVDHIPRGGVWTLEIDPPGNGGPPSSGRPADPGVAIGTGTKVTGIAPGLTGFVPNPAHGAARVVFTSAGAGPARIELFDLGGRRVLEHSLRTTSPGRQEVGFARGALAPGVYVIRLTQGGRVWTARGALVSR